MGNLIYVYGDGEELETALELLSDAGLAEHGRVIEGRAGDAGNGWAEARRERGERGDDTIAGAGVMPPAAALGAGVPLGTPAAMNPYAAVAVAGDAEDVASARTLTNLEDLVGGNRDEAEHYADVLRGGGSLLVIEGGGEVLDRAERVLAPHEGQGFARH